MSYLDHFINAPCHDLNLFKEAFFKGINDAFLSDPYDACPYGIPWEKQQWNQWDLMTDPNPQRADWYLGWWSQTVLGHIGTEFGPEIEKGALNGAAEMAALLWLRPTPPEAHFQEETITQEQIAEALGCSVEEVAERARREGWPYIYVPEDPERPKLTVYPAPQSQREDGHD